MIKKVYLFAIVLLVLPVISAETTFFEGELRDDFIMADLEEAEVTGDSGTSSEGIATESVPSSGGSCPPDYQLIEGKCIKKEIKDTVLNESEESSFPIELVCNTVFEAFRTQVKSEGEINSSSLDVEMIAIDLSQEQEIEVLAGDIQEYVSDFEEKCDSFLPLGISVELGIYKKLDLMILFILLGLVCLFIIGYLIFRLKKKRK